MAICHSYFSLPEGSPEWWVLTEFHRSNVAGKSSTCDDFPSENLHGQDFHLGDGDHGVGFSNVNYLICHICGCIWIITAFLDVCRCKCICRCRCIQTFGSKYFTMIYPDNVHKMSIDEQFCGILRVGRIMINSCHVRLQPPEAASHWKILKVPPGPVSWNTGNAFLSGSGILHQLLTRIAHQDFATITGFPMEMQGFPEQFFRFFVPPIQWSHRYHQGIVQWFNLHQGEILQAPAWRWSCHRSRRRPRG